MNRLLMMMVLMMTCSLTLASPPADFPRFIVPGHEKEMNSIRDLFWHHYEPAGPLIPLWDEWMPMSTLWPARGTLGSSEMESMRSRWAEALLSRPMDADGYVMTLQHDGPADAEGWPFPLWSQAGGIGWHFRGTGVQGYDEPLVKPDGWKVTGAKSGDVNDKGWVIDLTEPHATIQAPACSVSSRAMPWLRLNWWAGGLDHANCYVEWTTKLHPEFSRERRAYFSPAGSGLPYLNGDGKLEDARETRTMIPLYSLPGWEGQTFTGFRIGFDNADPAKVIIKSFHTACDTRHNVNNPNLIRGSHDYFLWSRDISFLRAQMPRLRASMRFMQRAFHTLDRKCVYMTWIGHEGRSGVRYVDGKKQVIPNEGIGSNYWDILPFGGEDALGTIYYYDACRDLADLEELIAQHPQWDITTSDAFNPADLRKDAEEVRAYGQKRFWNPDTGRFGTVDLDGKLHDYGFTFLNNEAVYYGFASAEQARSIHSWLSGQRIVKGDTSTGADIYHFRFGPRSTTKRNIDYYFWGWSSPESIPFGSQVQDGGAVLGWSYHDLMQRLITAGPDDAAARLREIGKWFDDTQAAGGYRKYYEGHPERGSMQGGNIPGGLGLDKEFFESVLMPQVMLYGFMGFQPTCDGFTIDPKLPRDWPALTITRIHLHGHVLEITASQDKTIQVSDTGPADDPITPHPGKGWKLTSSPATAP
jgi:hypothetical protein